MIEYRNHITASPNVMLGKACIQGTRITVELILEKLSDGESAHDILASYPQLKNEDIMACLAYAADAISHEEMINEK